MIDIGIYVHLVDSNLIKDLLNILTVIGLFFFLLFWSWLFNLGIYLWRFGQINVLLNTISRKSECGSSQIPAQAHLSDRYLRHYLISLLLLLMKVCQTEKLIRASVALFLGVLRNGSYFTDIGTLLITGFFLVIIIASVLIFFFLIVFIAWLFFFLFFLVFRW